MGTNFIDGIHIHGRAQTLFRRLSNFLEIECVHFTSPDINKLSFTESSRFALFRFLHLGFFLFFFLFGIVSAPRFFDSCASAFFFSFFFSESSALRAFSIPTPRLFSFLFPLRNRQRSALLRFLPAFALSRLSSLRAHAGACHQVLSPFANRFATGIGTYGTVKQKIPVCKCRQGRMFAVPP